MSWNYRICKKVIKGLNHDATVYGMHEAFCNDDGSVYAVTKEPILVVTDILPCLDEKEEEALKDIKQTLEWMQLALERPVIDLDTFKFAKMQDHYIDGEETGESSSVVCLAGCKPVPSGTEGSIPSSPTGEQ